jgi:tRNA threonylcarbamoyladenosine biosynthesis protein TsaE
MKWFLNSEEETLLLGKELLPMLKPGMLIFLEGDLGAGKTTLVRGILRALGYEWAVKSPTYTIVEEYILNERPFYHFDLYRLADPEELEWMGIADYLSKEAVCFMEWPQKGEGYLPCPDMVLTFEKKEGGREVVMSQKNRS